MAKKYSEDHEWVSIEDDVATCGISIYAAEQLGDVVYVELPEVGKSFKLGDEIATVESVKAASEIYAPLSGEVTEINPALEETPETVNEGAETVGWFFKIKLSDASEADKLMDEAAYASFTA